MFRMVFSVSVLMAIILFNRFYHLYGNSPAFNRNRIFKFAVCQDFLVALSILKMILVEGYTMRGVVQRLRCSGPLTHLYLVTVAVLHGALLFDEPTDHRLRLTPTPYTPPALREYLVDLFLL